jgi:hypothetical protein
VKDKFVGKGSIQGKDQLAGKRKVSGWGGIEGGRELVEDR